MCTFYVFSPFSASFCAHYMSIDLYHYDVMGGGGVKGGTK